MAENTILGEAIRLRDYQVKALKYSEYDRLLLHMAIGTGKTFCSLALQKQHNTSATLIIVPASLVLQWGQVLNALSFKFLIYAGTKRQRSAKDFSGYNFVIMSYQIFKNDFDKILKYYKTLDCITLIIDEAQAIKNIRSKNHKLIKKFVSCLKPKLILLSGSIITQPLDAYGICKILNPEAYRTLAEFKVMHVKKEDFFGNPIEYQRLDLLKNNLYKNAYVVGDEVLNLEEPVILPVPYILKPKHLKFYKTLLSDRFIEFEDEQFIDITEATTLFHYAQQIVVAPETLTENINIIIESNITKILKDILNTIDGKVVIFTRYQATSEKIFEYFKDVSCLYYGKNKKDHETELKKFLENVDKKIIVISLQSGGTGLDGLQKVCNHVIFAEPPLTPVDFEQATGRLRRVGQDKPVKVFLLYAKNTIQESLYEALNNKQSILQKVTNSRMKEIMKV